MSRRGAAPAVAGVTVPQVIRQLGLESQKHVAWAVGRMAADLWRERTGVDPAVALVVKSSGAGTHHMAVYPRDFRRTLVRLVKLAAVGGAPRGIGTADPLSGGGASRQRDLFP